MLACSVKSFILLPKWVGKCVKNILVMEPVIGPLAIRPKGGSLQCPDTSKVFVSKKQSLKCWFWIFLGVEWQQTLKKKKKENEVMSRGRRQPRIGRHLYTHLNDQDRIRDSAEGQRCLTKLQLFPTCDLWIAFFHGPALLVEAIFILCFLVRWESINK